LVTANRYSGFQQAEGPEGPPDHMDGLVDRQLVPATPRGGALDVGRVKQTDGRGTCKINLE